MYGSANVRGGSAKTAGRVERAATHVFAREERCKGSAECFQAYCVTAGIRVQLSSMVPTDVMSLARGRPACLDRRARKPRSQLRQLEFWDLTAWTAPKIQVGATVI